MPPYPKKGRDETYQLTIRFRASSGVRGTKRNVVHLIDRVSDPPKPATLFVGAGWHD